VIPVDYTELAKLSYVKASQYHLIMSGTLHYSQLEVNKRLEMLEKITGMPMDTLYVTPPKFHFNQDEWMNL